MDDMLLHVLVEATGMRPARARRHFVKCSHTWPRAGPTESDLEWFLCSASENPVILVDAAWACRVYRRRRGLL